MATGKNVALMRFIYVWNVQFNTAMQLMKQVNVFSETSRKPRYFPWTYLTGFSSI